MTDIQARLQRAAESILDNEALSADLDDEAANVLLDWGVALAQQIASETIELDDATAEEMIYQPMRALRKMLRAVNQLALAPNEEGLTKIISQAESVYGIAYVLPDEDQHAQWMQQIYLLGDNPTKIICELRDLIEGQKNAQTR